MTLVLLGAAWTFAIFAGNTITNVPEVGTEVLGDMGTFPGSELTGFPPGLVSGSVYLAGSYAEIVIGDIQKAYNNATGQASTQTMSDTDLGGLTLSPGVYKYDVAAALSAGQLFFDANGDPNAVWIFQIGSSLTVAAGTSMIFTSGVGNSNNVFWAVGSSATIEDGASFIGNILSYATISCNAGVGVNGRLLSLNGAVTLINNKISFPGGESFSPSMTPTAFPSTSPSLVPSMSPSALPSSFAPSISPTLTPTHLPSLSFSPSASPRSKSESSDLSQSEVILASVFGAIGGLIVIGVVVGLILSKTGVGKGAIPPGEGNQEMNSPVGL